MSAPSLHAAATTAPTIWLGLSTGALWPHHATLDCPAIAASLGLTDLEVMLQTPAEYTITFGEELTRAVDAAKCRIWGVHVKHGRHPLFDPDPHRALAGRTLFQDAINVAARLGARTLVWHGPDRKDLAREGTRARFLDVTRELAAACGAAGVTLAVENVSWCALATVRDVNAFAARLPELAPPEWLGFAFDPFQAAEADANPFMILAAMANRVVDVHLSDFRDGEGISRHLPPGDGDLPWPAILRAITGAYQGPLMIESPLGPDPAPTLERIRSFLIPLLADARADRPIPPPGVRRGIELFNAGEFYECHEVIEHEWHAERGPIRTLYQGILQIGVGFHHARNGNQRGAVLLLTDGVAKVSEFTPSALGIDTARLVAESQVCLDQIITLGPERISEFDLAGAPKIARGF